MKKTIIWILVILLIIVFTIVWKNSQKDETDKGMEIQTPITETEAPAPVEQKDTAASINEDLNKINVDSGIDADLNSVDSDVKTL